MQNTEHQPQFRVLIRSINRETKYEIQDQMSSTRARIINNNDLLIIPAPKQQIPDSKSDNDGDKHTAVERHDREHKEVTKRGVNPEEYGSGKPPNTPPATAGEYLGFKERSGVHSSIGVVANGGGREELESETAIFHVLVEDGEKEASD